MNRNGAMMFIFTLGMSSVMTFALGLLLGYALFSPKVQTLPPAEQVAQQEPAEPAPENGEPAEKPDSNTPAQPVPNDRPVSAQPAASTPGTVAQTAEDIDPQIARHLFIAVNGQWLADGTRALLQEVQPGGVILRPGNITSQVQTRSLVQEIKATSGGANRYDWPLVAVSQEGGPGNVLRVDNALPAVDLGLSNDKLLARQLGQSYGEAAADYGINIVLGPMLDVYDDTTAFPDLRTRSFGPDQTRAAGLGLAMAEGIRSADVIAVAKHFPGYASAGYSSDGISVVLHQDFDGLARAMYPFSEAANNAIQGMIVGHIGVPLLDKSEPYRSAALSPVMVQQLLRERWQYEGVIIADDIAFNSMTRSRPVERAAVEALIAGCDAIIFLDPNPAAVRSVIGAIERAVAIGELSIDQLERSKTRLEKWRFSLGGKPFEQPEPDRTQVALLQELASEEPDTPATETTGTPETTATPNDIISTPSIPGNNPETDESNTEQTAPQTPPATDEQMIDEPTAVEPVAAEPDTTEAPSEDSPAAADETEPETADPTSEVEIAAATPDSETPPNAEAPEPEKPIEETSEPAVEPMDISNMVPVDYEVKDGETLLEIAWAYDVSADDIITWNSLESAEAVPGSTLQIYVPVEEGKLPPPDPEPESQPQPEGNQPDAEAKEEELEQKMIVALAEMEKEFQAELEPKQAEPEVDAPAESTTEPEETSPADPEPETTPAPEPAPETETDTESTDPEMKPEIAEEPEETTGDPASNDTPPTEEQPEPVAEEMTVAEATEESEPDSVPESASTPDVEVEALEPEPEVLELPAESEIPPATTTPYKVVHQVQWGETLTSIAATYSVQVVDIRHWNEMAADAELQANSSLLIYVESEEQMTPTREPAPLPEGDVTTYEVQPGDTMSKIAREHNTSIDVIVTLNSLKNPNAIFVGQKLKVPAI